MKFDGQISVTSPSFARSRLLRDKLIASFPNAQFTEGGKRLDHEEVTQFLRASKGAIIGLEKVDHHLLSNCPKLKIIAKYGVGLDNIDEMALQEHGVSLGWTGGVNRFAVAEQALGLMISLGRNLFSQCRNIKEGRWAKDGGRELSEQTVGIVGAGFVGKALINLLRPFGCKILVNDILSEDSLEIGEGVEYVDKDFIYTNSDILSIHVPLSKTTESMIDRNVFNCMKKTAFLINTSRGKVVEQSDLKEALQNERIAGAGIDVYAEEPPTDTEFLQLPNLICTPHSAGNSRKAIESMGISAINHLIEFFMNDEKEGKR